GGALLTRTLFRGSPMAQPVAIVLGLWIGLALYTLLSLIVVDLARLATRVRPKDPAPRSPERRAFLARAVAAGSVASGVALAGWGVFRAYEPATVHEVPVR